MRCLQECETREKPAREIVLIAAYMNNIEYRMCQTLIFKNDETHTIMRNTVEELVWKIISK